MAPSPKKAFAQGVDRVIRLHGWRGETTSTFRRRLAAGGDRMESVFRLLKGDPQRIDLFLTIVWACMCFCADRERLQEQCRRLRADEVSTLRSIEVLKDKCRRMGGRSPENGTRRPDSFAKQFPDLERDLERFGRFVREQTAANLQGLEPFLPKSRDRRSDLVQRVHFARLMVWMMMAEWKPPRFQEVADTMNLLYAFKRPVTANSVRNAWRRHGPPVRSASIRALRFQEAGHGQ
jgi:hypothetical protein